MERVIGHQLRESQQLVIQVMSVTVEQPPPTPPTDYEPPPWSNIYEGLSDAEVDELDQAIRQRAELARLIGTTASVICRLENADYDGHSLVMLRRIAYAVQKRVEIRFVPAVRKARPA